MSEIELRECPFCGSDDVRVGTDFYQGETHIFCSDCGCQGPYANEGDVQGAIKLWNTRARKMLEG